MSSDPARPGVASALYMDVDTGHVNPPAVARIAPLGDLATAVETFLNRPDVAYDRAHGDGLVVQALPLMGGQFILLRAHPAIAQGQQTGLYRYLQLRSLDTWFHDINVAVGPGNPGVLQTHDAPLFRVRGKRGEPLRDRGSPFFQRVGGALIA
ncbi:MAG: hypothetical protein Q6373_026065 [Candidatus Sigynarchaeota archaeon]